MSDVPVGDDLPQVQRQLQTILSEHSLLQERIGRLRDLQRQFRRAPIGGRLLGLKRLAFWFVASGFDRQAKVQEATLDLIDDVVEHLERTRIEQARRAAELQRSLWSAQKREPPSEAALPVSRLHLAHLPVVFTARAEMLMGERVLLYGLVHALRPRHVLEIGSSHGGSGLIICAALDDVANGSLVMVDPNPQLSVETWQSLRHRATLLKGNSPDILAEARALSPDGFDFALIDGDHSYEGVLRDIEGTLTVVASRAYLLFHDCHFVDVEEAIDEALRRYPQLLTDCGVLSVEENRTASEGFFHKGKPIVWAGLRLLRYAR